jgi:pre-mRNA-processing factor 19
MKMAETGENGNTLLTLPVFFQSSRELCGMALCSISGQAAEVPVVSLRSGLVFESRLISKYLREKGTCPITGEALAAEDLLPLKINKSRPRAAAATSIPGLLSTFHDEWWA